MCYKMIQLTNTSVGAIATNGFMPLGVVTRKINGEKCPSETFNVNTSGANIIYINEKGYYEIIYNASLIATAAGNVTIELIANGNTIYSVVETATEGEEVNITLAYVVRAFSNCASCANNLPLSIQIKSTGVALTNGTSNIILQRRDD